MYGNSSHLSWKTWFKKSWSGNLYMFRSGRLCSLVRMASNLSLEGVKTMRPLLKYLDSRWRVYAQFSGTLQSANRIGWLNTFVCAALHVIQTHQSDGYALIFCGLQVQAWQAATWSESGSRNVISSSMFCRGSMSASRSTRRSYSSWHQTASFVHVSVKRSVKYVTFPRGRIGSICFNMHPDSFKRCCALSVTASVYSTTRG